MYNEFNKHVSAKLSNLVQNAVKKFNITSYILPDDATVEISIVDTSTVYSKKDYKVATLAADGSSLDDRPGVYGPQTSIPAFWIITILITLWTLAIITISIVYFI